MKENDKDFLISGLAVGIENSCWDLAKYIENAKSRKEAYIVFDKLYDFCPNLATFVWDVMVDWEKVKWEDA